MAMLSKKCVCCGLGHVRPWRPEFWRCPDCGHVSANAMLSDGALAELYSDSYFVQGEYLDYAREEAALRRNFRGRLRELRFHVPRGGRLLEVGCAYGYFLDEASKHFEVYGCDISAHATGEAAKRHPGRVVCGDIASLRGDRPFDAICMWDTIEHLPDPDTVIHQASRLLRPGGVLMFSTGDIASAVAQVRGMQWRQIHPPSHLHYFTPASAVTVLERHSFEDIRITHPAFWRTLDQVAFRTFAWPVGKKTSFLYDWITSSGLGKITFPVNLFDLMTVVAKRSALCASDNGGLMRAEK